eukprot:GHVT01042759.1.p1 GENE.GHVT01042759.1~~GHVT01042759.1.p1  ORF type:complete len:898 (+),score=247.08 GHVT01042759.1:419-3112(+)
MCFSWCAPLALFFPPLALPLSARSNRPCPRLCKGLSNPRPRGQPLDAPLLPIAIVRAARPNRLPRNPCFAFPSAFSSFFSAATMMPSGSGMEESPFVNGMERSAASPSVASSVSSASASASSSAMSSAFPFSISAESSSNLHQSQCQLEGCVNDMSVRSNSLSSSSGLSSLVPSSLNFPSSSNRGLSQSGEDGLWRSQSNEDVAMAPAGGRCSFAGPPSPSRSAASRRMIRVRTSTWNRDSHDLFDYETRNVVEKDLWVAAPEGSACGGAGEAAGSATTTTDDEPFLTGPSALLPGGGTITRIYRVETDIVATQDAASIPPNADYLLTVITEAGKSTVYPADKNSMPSAIAHTLTPKKVWLIVRDLPQKQFGLSESDVIKLGRFKLRVKQLIKPGQEIPTLSIEDHAPPISRTTEEELPFLQCRICLQDGNASPGEDPLISPCRCRGSIEFVHVECLRHWIKGRLNLDEERSAVFLRTVNCELCKANFPEAVHHNDERIQLLRVPNAEPPFIVLENIVGVGQTQRGVHVISLTEKKDLRLGRGHESDVRIPDVSISRCHAAVRFVDEKFHLEDYDSKFGTLISLRKPFVLPAQGEIALQIGRSVVRLRHALLEELPPKPRADALGEATGADSAPHAAESGPAPANSPSDPSSSSSSSSSSSCGFSSSSSTSGGVGALDSSAPALASAELAASRLMSLALSAMQSIEGGRPLNSSASPSSGLPSLPAGVVPSWLSSTASDSDIHGALLQLCAVFPSLSAASELGPSALSGTPDAGGLAVRALVRLLEPYLDALARDGPAAQPPQSRQEENRANFTRPFGFVAHPHAAHLTCGAAPARALEDLPREGSALNADGPVGPNYDAYFNDQSEGVVRMSGVASVVPSSPTGFLPLGSGEFSPL